MKKIYCIKCNKYRKFENLKPSYIFDKTLVLSQEFSLKNIDDTRNYLIEEINQNELKSKKHKKVCAPSN